MFLNHNFSVIFILPPVRLAKNHEEIELGEIGTRKEGRATTRRGGLKGSPS